MSKVEKVWESVWKAETVWESVINFEKVCYKLRKYEKVCQKMRKYEKVCKKLRKLRKLSKYSKTWGRRIILIWKNCLIEMKIRHHFYYNFFLRRKIITSSVSNFNGFQPALSSLIPMPKLVSHHVLPNNLKLIGWQGKNCIPISNLIERKCVKSWES